MRVTAHTYKTKHIIIAIGAIPSAARTLLISSSKTDMQPQGFHRSALQYKEVDMAWLN